MRGIQNLTLEKTYAPFLLSREMGPLCPRQPQMRCSLNPHTPRRQAFLVWSLLNKMQIGAGKGTRGVKCQAVQTPLPTLSSSELWKASCLPTKCP